MILLLRLVWLLAWALALPWRLARRLAARTRAGTFLVVRVDGRLSELPAVRRRWPGLALLSNAAPPFSLHDFSHAVAQAARDRRVTGLVVELRSFRGGMATAASLRSVLGQARTAGKQVVVHLPLGGGTRETYVAVAGDRVLLGPQASLAPVGLLSAARYVRGALDRAGIVPEVHARGDYKTAAERIARSSMSDAQREQVGALLDGAYGEILGGLASGRRIAPAKARELVDGAPYLGEEAVEAGLVDGTVHEDELARALARPGAPSREVATLVPLDDWWRPRAAMRPRALGARGVVGVIQVAGAIAGEGGLRLGAMAVDEQVIGAVRLARRSRRVRAVVLHIDSPGGSALASARMHHELVQLAAEKPLIACMGDVAASGGYYVAVAAHAIVAQPATVTGSIGVIGARLVLEPLFARLGVVVEVLQRGAHARLLDPLLPLDDADRAAVDREIERTYRGFLGAVAEGRRRTIDEIEPLAGGRVWTGADALARGLVDRLGGFEEALRLARERVGRGSEQLRAVVVRPPRQAGPPLDLPARTAGTTLAAWLETAGEALGIDPSLLAFRRERVLAWAPGTEVRLGP